MVENHPKSQRYSHTSTPTSRVIHTLSNCSSEQNHYNSSCTAKSPTFILPRNTHCVPLTDSVARKHMKLVSNIIQLSPPLTFHAFRRAGASLAFQNGVPLEFIKKHGTWKSDAIHTYLTSTPSFTSPVSLAFSTSLYL